MQNTIKYILFIAGIIEVLVGLLHFGMPSWLYQSTGFKLLNQIESDYLLLVTYAVGILLIVFGILTMILSFKIKELKELIYYYLIIKTLLWTARIILEIIYPIQLSMFYVKPFTSIVLPGLIIEFCFFLLSTILMKKYILNTKKHIL